MVFVIKAVGKPEEQVLSWSEAQNTRRDVMQKNQTPQEQARNAWWNRNQAKAPTIIILEGDDWFEIETPYSPALVASLKTLPAQDRYWDKPRKRWGFKDKHRESIRMMLDVNFTKPTAVRVEQMSETTKMLREQAAIVANFTRQETQKLRTVPNPEDITF
jgi:hypothetical protein